MERKTLYLLFDRGSHSHVFYGIASLKNCFLHGCFSISFAKFVSLHQMLSLICILVDMQNFDIRVLLTSFWGRIFK